MIDKHTATDQPTESERALMKPRVKAFIFPSIPRLDYEITAFNEAVDLQIMHEKTLAEKAGDIELPDGVKSFDIGEFSMSFEDGATSSRLTKKTICPSAYGVLLEAGLMYKGVEGRLTAWH